MKKVLFLTYNYPYGHFGPSDNCSVKIMKALVDSGGYEVHNVSYSGSKQNYYIEDGIITHQLPFPEAKRIRSRFLIHLQLILSLPIYPLVRPYSCYRLYRSTRNLIRNEHFDLVVCQCNPEESLWTGTLLKKYGHIDKLMVIFWDNIYGKLPQRVISKRFAISRQRWAEGIVAKYADHLVSLYPIKPFHDKYGELPEAMGKRVYLGIPSVIRPKPMLSTIKHSAIADGKINILFSGTIFRNNYVEYLIELLNTTPIAPNINLIFFQRGVSSDSWNILKEKFQGSMFVSGWIPLQELLSIYPKVDFFMSYPGYPTSIRSKLFEYVSFGKPLIVLFDDDSDVNVPTFSVYPAFHCIDVRKSVSENVTNVAEYIMESNGKSIPFEDVERLFLKDSPKAFVELINDIVE